MTTLTVRPIDLNHEAPALAKLCWDYRDLLMTRTVHVPDIMERYYSQSDYAALIEQLPAIHARPKGDILVADLDGTPVGCAMYYLHGTGSCEIKRIFVDQSARGVRRWRKTGAHCDDARKTRWPRSHGSGHSAHIDRGNRAVSTRRICAGKTVLRARSGLHRHA